MKILAATTNKGKIEEIKEILKGIEIITLKDIKNTIEVIEDKDTFEENAQKKAKQYYKETKIPSLADDSGICIKEYNEWPGVETSRFLGEEKSGNEHSRERNQYILDKMRGLPKEKREVKYITTIAYFDGRHLITKQGIISGYISENMRGENGFGFDEIFELEDGRTLGELNNLEKNEISSRKKALEKIKQEIFRIK